MSKEHFLLSVWCTIALYCFSSAVFGHCGILAQRQLVSERDRIATNLENLREINDQLQGAVESLRSDGDSIQVHARELGYGREDEQFVRVVGLSASGMHVAQAGNLLMAARFPGIRDRDLRVMAILCGMALFITLTVLDLKKRP